MNHAHYFLGQLFRVSPFDGRLKDSYTGTLKGKSLKTLL